MADATPSTYITGIILFVIVTVAGISMVGMFAADDPAFITGPTYGLYTQAFNKTAEITAEVEALQDTIESTSADPGPFGVLNALVSGSWASLRLIFTSFGFMADVFNGLESIFHVPGWLIGLVTLIIVVMLAFRIFSAIFQSEL
jgi:hypothetical protein